MEAPRLRVIGDVHGQVDVEPLVARGRRPYCELIEGTPCSVQVGDMGDAETYEQLRRLADPSRHRFIPGNHDHYDCLPEHSLGDYGEATLGGVSFFFVRGAESKDREKLTALGTRLGRTLWFESEELTDEQMSDAEQAYCRCRPEIVLSHDGPEDAARAAWRQAARRGYLPPGTKYQSSRTSLFLDRLLSLHRPRLWLFGHYHHNWSEMMGSTRFVCVGELSYAEITADAGLCVLS